MKVLYVLPFVPYEGIPHAGGYFLYMYLTRLARFVEIRIVAPRTEENIKAVRALGENWQIDLVGDDGNVPSGLLRQTRLVWDSLFHPVGLPDNGLKPVAEYLRLSGALKDVDLVEIQFSQMLPLVKTFKRVRPDLPVIGFEHDVFTQSIRRRVSDAPLTLNKLLNILKLVRVRAVETELVNRCDAVFVFSEKDARLLKDMQVSRPIDVMVPSIEIPKRIASLEGEPTCLFVGAMGRKENYESALWFIRNVWPSVQEKIPNAKLQIVGANPPEELKAKANSNVIIPGFVYDLSEFYEKASLCVAPLLTGAGVKFKVLQAMAYGLPVVSTPVGIEGIAEAETKSLFPYITMDSQEFAAGILSILSNEDERKRIGAKLREWVEKHYDFDSQTISQALRIYRSLLVSKPRQEDNSLFIRRGEEHA